MLENRDEHTKHFCASLIRQIRKGKFLTKINCIGRNRKHTGASASNRRPIHFKVLLFFRCFWMKEEKKYFLQTLASKQWKYDGNAARHGRFLLIVTMMMMKEAKEKRSQWAIFFELGANEAWNHHLLMPIFIFFVFSSDNIIITCRVSKFLNESILDVLIYQFQCQLVNSFSIIVIWECKTVFNTTAN